MLAAVRVPYSDVMNLKHRSRRFTRVSSGNEQPHESDRIRTEKPIGGHDPLAGYIKTHCPNTRVYCTTLFRGAP
jgi:hypothetical protein